MIYIKSMIFSSTLGLKILLALFLFMAPSGAQAPGQLTGSATDWDEIYITAPADIDYGIFTPGITSEKTGILNVDATGSWKVEVNDANSDTSGYMTKYNVGSGTYETGVKLGSRMSISATGGYERELMPTNQEICSGDATPQGGQELIMTFKQPISWSDQALQSGYKYRIEMTFTGSLMG